MADLDHFFAKKDRKKSKTVKKFSTADELAKKLDDPKQKPDVRPKKERPVQEGEEPKRGPDEEEEWKEYEEMVKDYTGLKIQVLQAGNGAPDSGRDSASEDCPSDNGKVKGPWNKPNEGSAPAAQEPPAPAAAAPASEAPRPSAYVPPPSRHRPAEPVRRPQNKNAPDIHNDDNFPVLGVAAKRGAPAGGGWSTAAGGGGAGGGGARAGAAGGAASRQPLALGNRFTSLQDDS